jgi:hypothetical protein
MPRQTDAERLEGICAALPEVVITRHDQHTAFEVRGKKFAWHVVDEHGDGRVAVLCKAGRGDNEALVAGDPTRLFLPKYVAHHGWVGLYLDLGTIDWDEVGELVTDSYLLTAPSKLAAQVQQSNGA